MKLETLCHQVIQLCEQTSKYIREQSGKFQTSDVEEKGLHDLVSYVDRKAEVGIMDRLRVVLPKAGFIAEESGTQKAGRFNWIIDPLDGTTNFVHGIPVYAISIALQEYDETIMGIVYEVNRDECFYSWKGGKAYCNGKEIVVSKAPSLDASLVATGFPYYDFTRMKPYLGLFEDLMQHTRGIRRLGSAAIDLAYVACGRFEVFYEYGLHPWDVAAGAFLVQQAGGRISTFDGGDGAVFGKDIIASNGKVHDEMLRVVERYFG